MAFEAYCVGRKCASSELSAGFQRLMNLPLPLPLGSADRRNRRLMTHRWMTMGINGYLVEQTCACELLASNPRSYP